MRPQNQKLFHKIPPSISITNYNFSGITSESQVCLLEFDIFFRQNKGAPDLYVRIDSATGSGDIVNPEYYGIHELIPMGSTRPPNQGGGERGFVDCALTLGVYHPGAHGKIVDPS